MGPHGSIGAHTKTGTSYMAQDHFWIPFDPLENLESHPKQNTNLIKYFQKRLPKSVLLLRNVENFVKCFSHCHASRLFTNKGFPNPNFNLVYRILASKAYLKFSKFFEILQISTISRDVWVIKVI